MMVVSRLSSLLANSSPNVLVGHPDSHAGLPSWHRGLALLVSIASPLCLSAVCAWSLVLAV
jgi:hypothetical protein